jgi:hypothetical protein
MPTPLGNFWTLTIRTNKGMNMQNLTTAQLTQITGGALNRSTLVVTSRNALSAANTKTSSQRNDISKGQWVSHLPQIVCKPD